MKTYKNSDVARKYKVTLPSVGRWIENAIEGKNMLKLEYINGRYRIIQDLRNDNILIQLKESGSVKRNKTAFLEVHPDQELYDILTPDQIDDLYFNLYNSRELPLRYTYLNGGAKVWAEMSAKSIKFQSTNAYLSTPQLLKSIEFYLQNLSEEKNIKYNIIDLGPGDGENIKCLISQLDSKNLINKYIAVDISQEMLDIAKTNIIKQFPSINYSEFVINFESENLLKILCTENTENIINLVLLVGNTLGNVQDQLLLFKNIENSISQKDLFIFSNRLSNHKSISRWGHINSDNRRQMFIPKLLGIDVEKSKFTIQYSEILKSRIATLTLDKDYIINFKNKKLHLGKDEEIILWKHKLTSFDDIQNYLENTTFIKLLYITTADATHFISIFRKKKQFFY